MQQIKYNVDIVMCIDVTYSMSHIIEPVKENASKFFDDLSAVMQKKKKRIDHLRAKVVAFRDYYEDAPEMAMQESSFFDLPDQQDAFSAFVRDLRADGGGDEPECGLEALALAIRSDWLRTGEKRRQIIIVWTDASTHPLEKSAGSKPPGYPESIPGNFDALTDLWEGQEHIGPSTKRLIMFAPDLSRWTDMAKYWKMTVHFPSEAGQGLSEVDYSTILDVIANSV